jgi:hypothetical protein
MNFTRRRIKITSPRNTRKKPLSRGRPSGYIGGRVERERERERERETLIEEGRRELVKKETK